MSNSWSTVIAISIAILCLSIGYYLVIVVPENQQRTRDLQEAKYLIELEQQDKQAQTNYEVAVMQARQACDQEVFNMQYTAKQLNRPTMAITQLHLDGCTRSKLIEAGYKPQF